MTRFILQMLTSSLPLRWGLAWLLLAHSYKILACSAIAGDPSLSGLVAANYDWKARGGIIYQSPRGQRKTPTRFTDAGITPIWVSKYASLTVSQYGRDFPMQGMNEAGLLGLVLVAPADYPSQGPLGVMTEVSWLQYQLDMFSTVQDVANHAGDFGIEKVSARLHWFLCDASHECLSIEFRNGKPVVHQASDLAVRAITNSGFQEAMEAWESWQSSTAQSLPQGYNSLNRFIRLAHRGSLSEEQDLVTAINDVSLQGFTAFQTIFDADAKSMKVRLPGEAWRTVSFQNGDFNCRQNLYMQNLNSSDWVRYDSKTVEELFARASDGADDLTPLRRMKILENTNQVHCETVLSKD